MPRSEEENGAKASSRARRASESDTVFEVGHEKNVDILQMLSKAQDEYDKVCCATVHSCSLPIQFCAFVNSVIHMNVIHLNFKFTFDRQLKTLSYYTVHQCEMYSESNLVACIQ